MEVNGEIYTIGEIGEATVVVIKWNGDEQEWSRTVEYGEGDTVGDAIQRAKEKEGCNGN